MELLPRKSRLPAPSRRDGRNSPPNITRIVFNLVFLQEGNELSLEIARPMMLLLASDVLQRGAHLGPSNGERAITFLPFKTVRLGGLVHPERRGTLDFSHCCGDWYGRRQREQKMDVVLHSADAKGLHLVFAGDAAHVGPQTGLDFRCDYFAPLFGGKDTVEERTAIGV